MPQCFYCISNFLTLKNLKIHLMARHNFTAYSPIRCGEQNCFSGFSTMRRFENHFSKCHNNQQIAAEPVNLNMQLINADNENDNGEINLEAVPPEQEENERLNIVNDIDLQAFLLNRSSLLTSKLYCHPTIPLNAVQWILEEAGAFASASLSILQSKVKEALNREGGPIEEDVQEVNRSFTVLQKPFDGFDTEYKRIKFFAEKGIYIPAKEITIGQRKVKRRVKKVYREKLVDVTAQLIPLRETLKLLFEYKDTFNETQQYMHQLYAESNILRNVIQGTEWKRTLEKLQETRNNDLFFPLFIYNDEYEVCNPLGTHRGTHKLSAVYATVPCLPLTIQSCLNSVFLCLLFSAKHRKLCGNSVTFHEFIDELNFLHNTGILLEVNGAQKRLFFAVCLFVGDNLGMNQMLGLVECFVANYPCRICKMHLIHIQKSCREDPALFRDTVNYEEDLQRANASETGVKAECVWNRVEGFHATTHCAADAMHEILEGSAGLDIIFVLNSLMDAGFFTFEELCMKVSDFDYGVDCRNKPPDFAVVFQQDSLSLSAAEMLVIIRYLPLMIGEFIPRGNNIWELFLLLRDCVDLIFAPSLQENCAELLRTLIEEHHSLYRTLTKRNLTFKQHMMTHYPNLLLRFGPIRLLWCMAFERFHSLSKRAAAALICRKNTPKSVAKKHGLRLAHFYNSSSLFNDALESGPSVSVVKHTLEQLYNIPLQDLRDPCVETSWIQVYGILYKPSMMLFYDFQDDLPCFAFITRLLVSAGSPYYLCAKYETVSYDRHFSAYHVKKCDSFIVLSQSQLFDPVPLSRSEVQEEKYVTLKYMP